MGGLAFYGKENGQKSGWAKDYYRARDSQEAANDPFAIHLEDEPVLKKLYAEAEQHGRSIIRAKLMIDGYHRDMNVFAEDITIEDDMSVLVKYANGVTMTYHLTAYSVRGIFAFADSSHGKDTASCSTAIKADSSSKWWRMPIASRFPRVAILPV
jgi:hypothetical protein